MQRYRWRWPVALAWFALLPALPAAARGRAGFDLKLEVETGQKPAATPRRSPSGAVLVLNSMGETRRQQLAESLAQLAAAVAKQKNPFFVDLDDSEERKAVEDLIKQAAPAFTAASALCAGHWQSPEGDVQIRPVRHCRAGLPCVALREPPGSDQGERRARFLAWPLGYAVVLSLTTSKQADDVAQALRAPGSTQIGLVLTGAELHHLRKSPALDRLLEHARQVSKSVPPRRSPFLAAIATLANAARVKDELSWLHLPSESILIVPRLGALATSSAFVSDVRAQLPATAAQIEWLASPH